MKDLIMDIESRRESLIGGLWDEEEVNAEIEEMRNAKVGTIKPECWEKLDDDKFLIYSL